LNPPLEDQEEAVTIETPATGTAGTAVAQVPAVPDPKDPKDAALARAVRASLAQPSAHGIKKLDDMEQAAVDDRKTDTKLKKIYAYWFIAILIGQLLLMNLLFAAVGLKWLDFEDASHLNLFMGGTLTEVFGVVFVITRYLFSRKDGEAAPRGDAPGIKRRRDGA